MEDKEKAEGKENKAGKGWKESILPFHSAVISVLISILITAGGIYYYHRHYAAKIVVVDLAEYIAYQKERFVNGEIAMEEARANIKDIKTHIDGLPGNFIVMGKESIISGGEMLTLFPSNGGKGEGGGENK